jgi:hypothetical protein
MSSSRSRTRPRSSRRSTPSPSGPLAAACSRQRHDAPAHSGRAKRDETADPTSPPLLTPFGQCGGFAALHEATTSRGGPLRLQAAGTPQRSRHPARGPSSCPRASRLARSTSRAESHASWKPRGSSTVFGRQMQADRQSRGEGAVHASPTCVIYQIEQRFSPVASWGKTPHRSSSEPPAIRGRKMGSERRGRER